MEFWIPGIRMNMSHRHTHTHTHAHIYLRIVRCDVLYHVCNRKSRQDEVPRSGVNGSLVAAADAECVHQTAAALL